MVIIKCVVLWFCDLKFTPDLDAVKEEVRGISFKKKGSLIKSPVLTKTLYFYT